MKTYTVIKREGELLGPIDWSYDFESHSWNNGGCTNPKRIEQAVKDLWEIECALKAKKTVFVRMFGWSYKVLAIGMYDGWPYWRPVPSIGTRTTLGIEWHSFDSIGGLFYE
jgi:hypothetical protein